MISWENTTHHLYTFIQQLYRARYFFFPFLAASSSILFFKMQELVIYAYLTGSFQMIQISSFLLCGCLLSLAFFFFFLSLRGYDNTSHIVFINITCSLDMACRFCQTEHMEETFLVNSALVFSYADFRDRKNAFLLRFNFHRRETKPLNVREIVLTRLDTAPLNHIFWLKASFC